MGITRSEYDKWFDAFVEIIGDTAPTQQQWTMMRAKRAQVTDEAPGAALGAAAAPATGTTAIPPAVTYHAGPGGIRVDDVMPRGTPGTVYMEKTGHVLSVPQAEKGEMFVGYAQRISDQLDGGKGTGIINQVGALFLGVPMQGDGSPQYWPETLDRIYNAAAYQTEAERRATELARQQQIQNMQTVAGQQQAPAAPVPTEQEVPINLG